MTEYMQSPVCTLSPYNYKIEGTIQLNSQSELNTLCVFDTGAGPNLIRASHLDEDTLKELNSQRSTVHLRSASSHQLDVLGVVRLTLKVGNYVCKQPFAVT